MCTGRPRARAGGGGRRAHTNTRGIGGLHAPSLRQQFCADLLIAIATIIAVGGGDIMKIDCHKKATVQQKEGDCNGVLARVQRCCSASGRSLGLRRGRAMGGGVSGQYGTDVCRGGLRCFPNTHREVGGTGLCKTKKEERDGEPVRGSNATCDPSPPCLPPPVSLLRLHILFCPTAPLSALLSFLSSHR